MLKAVLHLALMAFPWKLRRLLLGMFFKYELHPTSRIGLSLVMPRRLVLGAHARIGHFTVCKGLELLQLGEQASIGRLNWISAFPLSDTSHFSSARKPELIVSEHSHITHRHLVDCTSSVRIDRYSVIGGYRSQILTHAVDFAANRQDSKPITIGEFCFVSTACILLGGSALPSCSLLGAGAVLNKAFTESHHLYAGVPARPVKALPPDLKYFSLQERLLTDSGVTQPPPLSNQAPHYKDAPLPKAGSLP